MRRRDFIGWSTAAAALPLGAASAAPTAEELLTGARLQEIWLEIEEQDWATLRERYLTNDWYWCRVTWNGVTAKAAVRSRGNGSRNAVKPSLKLSFTRSKDSGPFLGMTSLLLNNFAQDPSCLKNALSQALFTKMGLPAPRTSYARVYVNKTYQGIHAVSEEIDAQFLQRWFAQSDGWLYEYAWSDYYYFGERGASDEDYVPAPFELKNNTKNPQNAALVQFIEVVNRAGTDSFVSQLAPYLDVYQYLTFLAVEAFTDERDGQTGDWGLNGFFLYRFLQSTKFAFLPWDKDWSFMSSVRSVTHQLDQNVLGRRLLENRTMRSFFLDEVERCARLAGVAGGWLENEARQRSSAIWTSAQTDPNFLALTGTFAPASAQVMDFIQRRGTEVVRQVSALRAAVR